MGRCPPGKYPGNPSDIWFIGTFNKFIYLCIPDVREGRKEKEEEEER